MGEKTSKEKRKDKSLETEKDKMSKKSWISTQTDISKALESWSNVTEEIQQQPNKVAPDEKMLKDIENIIQVIKSKLEEFAPPS